MPDGEVPTWAVQIVSDVAKANAGVEYIRKSVDSIQVDLTRIETVQPPPGEHQFLMSEVRKLIEQRDKGAGAWTVVKWILAYCATVSTALLTYELAKVFRITPGAG